MSESAITQGAHHIGLTVPDLNQTREFFVGLLNFDQVGEVPDYPAVFLSDGNIMITLWQADDPSTAVQFDRKNVIGLHHFALKVDNSDDLTALHYKLSVSDDVDVEFAPESLGGSQTQHMMCSIPGGIRMELIAPAA